MHDEPNFEYGDLLEFDQTSSIHVKNLRFLMTEIFNTVSDINPLFMREIFVREDISYNLRSILRLNISKANTKSHGIDSISFRGSQIWNVLQMTLKRVPVYALLRIR